MLNAIQAFYTRYLVAALVVLLCMSTAALGVQRHALAGAQADATSALAQRDTAHADMHQFWTVALPMRKGQTKVGQAEQQAVAGELLGEIHGVLQGLKLPGCKKLELHDGPAVRYYPGGQAVFYMTYVLHCPLLT